MAADSPWRIDQIRELETRTTAQRKERNEETPGRYKHESATYFRSSATDDGAVGIDEVVAWSKTSHGGRQLPLLAPVPEGGCIQYGLCEPPSTK